MKEKVKISIPNPCLEKWDEMAYSGNGRHCMSCNKVVIDFTKASDTEIAAILSTDQKLCGRFRIDQLSKHSAKKKATSWKIAASAVLGLMGFTSNAVAQNQLATTTLTEKTPVGKSFAKGIIVENGKRVTTPVDIVNKDSGLKTTSNSIGEFMIEARIGDWIEFKRDDFKKTVAISTSNRNLRIELNDPDTTDNAIKDYPITVVDATGGLPGANIQVNDDSQYFQTDFDGKVTLKALPGDTLTVSWVGMEETKYILGQDISPKIYMKEGYVTLGVIVVERKQTFFGRAFRKIGRLFRK